MAWLCISPEMTVEVYKKWRISSAVDGTEDDMLWNSSDGYGDVGRECEEDEDTDCEDGDNDTDWYRQIECDMLCVFKLMAQYFLADILFTWGHLRLEPSCIQVNTVIL